MPTVAKRVNFGGNNISGTLWKSFGHMGSPWDEIFACGINSTHNDGVVLSAIPADEWSHA